MMRDKLSKLAHSAGTLGLAAVASSLTNDIIAGGERRHHILSLFQEKVKSEKESKDKKKKRKTSQKSRRKNRGR